MAKSKKGQRKDKKRPEGSGEIRGKRRGKSALFGQGKRD